MNRIEPISLAQPKKFVGVKDALTFYEENFNRWRSGPYVLQVAERGWTAYFNGTIIGSGKRIECELECSRHRMDLAERVEEMENI